MTAQKSRLPSWEGLDRSQTQFLDAIDRRQLAVAQLTDLASTATLADVITAFNLLLEAHRTK